MKKLFLLFVTLLFASCGTSISSKIANKNYQKLEEDYTVYVIQTEDVLPVNSEFIADVKVGDAGFTQDCGYDKVIADITNYAKKVGANIVQLVQVKKPSILGSTCYRIKAKVYRNLNPESLTELVTNFNLKNKSRLPNDSDYALVHFYRPQSGAGALLGYKIKDENDSIVGRLRNGEKFIYKTKKFGIQKFYGTLETRKEVIIDVKKGQEYFVRCGVTIGAVLGRPEINRIENYVGMNEFDEMN